jgi:hypothetical protein
VDGAISNTTTREGEEETKQPALLRKRSKVLQWELPVLASVELIRNSLMKSIIPVSVELI